MARRRTNWLGIASAIIALLIIVAIAVPFLIPANAIRDKVVAEVKQATGRDLAINGPVSVSVLPTLRVSAKDVSLSNAPWAGPQPMIRLSGLDVGLKLLPLLSGKIAVDKFVLQNPQIDLQTDKQGHGNWQFISAKPEGHPSTRQALPPIVHAEMRIDNGRLVYTSGTSGQSQTIDEVNLTARLADMDAPLTAEGSARWRGQRIDLAFSAAKARDLLQGSGSPVKLTAAANALNLAFQGSASMAGETKAEGDADLSVPSVRNLIAWAAEPPPELPPNGLGRLELKGHLATTGHHTAVDEMQFSMDAIKAAGNLALDTGGPRPALSGRLDFDRLDLNPYLPAEPSGGGPTAHPPGGWSDTPLDVSALKSADLDMSLSAASIAFRQIAIGKTAATVKLQNGRLDLGLQQVAIDQGTAHGRVAIDAASQPVAADVDLTLAKLEVEQLIKALAGKDFLTGIGGGQVKLTSRGNSERALVAGLNGSGRVSVTNGTIKGIDLASLITTAATSSGGAANAGATEFSDLSATFTVSDGIARNNDLTLATPLLHATGAGTVDLPHKSLDYRIVPQTASGALTKAMPKELGGALVPVLVRGPWDSLSYAPDLSGVTNRLLGRAGNQLGALLGGRKGKENEDQSGGAANGGKPSGVPGLPIPSLPIPGLGR